MSTEKVVYELSLRDLMSKGLNDINRKVGALESRLGSVQKATTKTSSIFSSLGGALSGAAIVGALGAIGKGIWDVTAGAEATKASFKVMLGSSEAAMGMIKDIREYSRKTPFVSTDIEQAAKTLMGYGITAENVMPSLKMLGDISLGDSEKLQRLTLAFAQTSAAGKLTGQDLLQYVNAGFNPLGTIAKKTGKSIGELREQMSDGLISADMVKEAMRLETSLGGRFFGGLEEQSKTLSGRLSTIREDIEATGRSIGEANIDRLYTSLDLISKALQSLEPFAEVFTSIISPLSGIIDLFDGITGKNGDSILTWFKTFATTTQLAFIPLQVALAQVLFAFDLIRGFFVEQDLSKAFSNFGERMSKPFKTLGDIWTDNKQKEVTNNDVKGGMFSAFGQEKDEYSGLKVFGAGANKEDIFAPLSKGESTGKEKLKKQASELSGGAPKVVNINVEALIKEVNNHFGSAGTAMQTEANEFLDQLQKALNTLLVDTAIIGGNN